MTDTRSARPPRSRAPAPTPETQRGVPGVGPLTPDDIHDAIVRSYQPWMVEFVLADGAGQDIGPWARGHMRPTRKGSAGTDTDGVARTVMADERGWNVELAGGPRDARWTRAGHISWARAESYICDRATPHTAEALREAVAAQHRANRGNDVHAAIAADCAAAKAWLALINPSEPEQLGLEFPEVR